MYVLGVAESVARSCEAPVFISELALRPTFPRYTLLLHNISITRIFYTGVHVSIRTWTYAVDVILLFLWR